MSPVPFLPPKFEANVLHSMKANRFREHVGKNGVNVICNFFLYNVQRNFVVFFLAILGFF